MSKEKTTDSQNKQILEWLQAGNSITPLFALKKFGCLRLGARIWDLSHGQYDGFCYPILSMLVKDEETGKHFSSYSLAYEPAAA